MLANQITTLQDSENPLTEMPVLKEMSGPAVSNCSWITNKYIAFYNTAEQTSIL